MVVSFTGILPDPTAAIFILMQALLAGIFLE
jgi:hypothetical protein